MENTIAALKAGKHVIVEKPMAMNVDQCQNMIDVANKTGKKLMIAHCLRFTNSLQYIKQLIDSKQLGTIITATSDFLSEGRKSTRTWKYRKDIAGGGAMFDLGVHMVDTLRYLIQSEIIGTNLIRKPASTNEIDEIDSLLMNFESNVIGRITCTYQGPRCTFLEVVGTQGYVRAYDWNLPDQPIRIEHLIEGKFSSMIVQNNDPYTAEIDAFATSILNQKPIPVSGLEGLKNQQIIDLVN
jgi:1,5-anhydro-D-fructose reductase (1,5-anhydro-D-mannitol-forming)